VLLLSRMIGQDVRDPDGRVLGRLADLTVSVAGHGGTTMVDRILMRRRHANDLLLPWEAAGSVRGNHIGLTSDRGGSSVATLADVLGVDEILLSRDVLDTQIVDIAGQRLARVADVVLAHRRDGHLEVAGVEVGFGAVLRRLGLDWLASRTRDDMVAWADLHLTSARGHAVQLATPRSAVHLLDTRGLAVLVGRLDTGSATEVLAAKGPDVAAGVIAVSHPVIAERLLRAMDAADAAEVVAAMPARHGAYWGNLIATPRVLRGRRFLRSRVWPRRRPPPGEAFR
jgi:sporulation protein YlmC with PRC-barrel domain